MPLVVAAVPIGNPGDASRRLADELARADIVAAEDTRRVRRLTSALAVTRPGRLVSFFEGNEVQRTAELLAALRSGSRVLLVTDAGTPLVSDPGYRLVVAAVDAGIPVTVVPGPSAVTAALAVSGLPVDRFCFEGFLPRRSGERARRLAELADEPRTMVFFEAPHRLAPTLTAMAEAFGARRRGVVCRELTKVHEEVRRDTLAALLDWASAGVRGEVTLVVAGAAPRPVADADPAALAAAVAAREAGGETRKAAIAAIAATVGVPRRAVYDAVVTVRRPSSDESKARRQLP